MDFNTLLTKQYDIFLSRKIQSCYHNRWKQKNFLPIKCQTKEEMLEFLTKLSNTKKGTWEDIIFITISSPDNTDTLLFIEKCLALCSLAIFKGYMTVFEQRGSTPIEAGKGLHAHMLLTRNRKYNKGKIISRFLKSLKNKNIYNNKQNNEINLRKQMKKKSSYFSMQFPFNDKLLGKVDYLLGGKNEDKLDKVEVDKLWRETYEIESYYFKECEYLKENKILQYIIKKNDSC